VTSGLVRDEISPRQPLWKVNDHISNYNYATAVIVPVK
jgi:hypothetical protein